MTANRIKQLRVEQDLTQQDLADYLNVSAKAVSYYETDKRQMPYRVLKDLAKKFNVSIEYLLGDSDVRNGFDVFKAEDFSESQKKAAEMLNAIKKALVDKEVQLEFKRTLKNVYSAQNPLHSDFVELYEQLDANDKAELKGIVRGMLMADKYKKQYSNEKVG